MDISGVFSKSFHASKLLDHKEEKDVMTYSYFVVTGLFLLKRVFLFSMIGTYKAAIHISINPKDIPQLTAKRLVKIGL